MSRRPATPRARRAAWSALGAVALAAGCGERGGPSAELFPLEPGHRWTYRQVAELEDGARDVVSLVLRTLPGEDYEDRPAFRRRSDDGVLYWLRRDPTGIYRVASRHELQPEPVKDAAPRYVLKEPLAVGTEWQAPTVAYLLKRTQGYPPELRNEGKPVAMRYAIEALQETVTVPAGRFERCVRVRGSGTLKLYADGTAGWRDMPLITLEWYCPGPGLVKLEREEPAKSPFLIGGRLTMELQEWERP
jgi:hypothetical protein